MALGAAALLLPVLIGYLILAPHIGSNRQPRTTVFPLIDYRIGDRYMRIPNNYLERIRFEETVIEGGVHAVDGISLVGTAPEFLGRTASNRSVFRANGSDPTIRVAILPVNRLPASEVLTKMRPIYTGGDVVSQSSNHTELVQQVKAHSKGACGSSICDVFISFDKSFTSCGRVEGSVISPRCENVITMGNNIVTISFGRKWISKRHYINGVVKERIRQWSIAEPTAS